MHFGMSIISPVNSCIKKLDGTKEAHGEKEEIEQKSNHTYENGK